MQWHWYPSVLIGTGMLTGVYFTAAIPLRWRFAASEPISRSQKTWFLLGVFAILIALVSPVDEIGDQYLFTAHMLQHLLLALVAPPLLLLGVPGWMFGPFLRWPAIVRFGKWITRPLLAFGLFNLVFMVWHMPALYEAALHNENIHLIEHLFFITTGLLTWWPILSPVSEWPRLQPSVQVLYLFLQGVPMSILGALIEFSPTVLYSTYEAAPQLFQISALADQQIAGLVMWMLGGMIYLFALSVVFFQWLAQEERAA